MYRVSTATTSSSQEYDYEDPDSTMMSVNILNELRRDACVKQNPALDEIEDYLADPVAKTTVDVLGWWSGNSKRFPSGLPFALFIGAGIYYLKEFQEVRYKYRRVEPFVDKLHKQYPEFDIKNKKETIQDIYERSIKKSEFDQWENIRGPRFYEPETLNIKERVLSNKNKLDRELSTTTFQDTLLTFKLFK
ncbi:unnamed protein product [Gordionus sp. m RMFG-2023]